MTCRRLLIITAAAMLLATAAYAAPPNNRLLPRGRQQNQDNSLPSAAAVNCFDPDAAQMPVTEARVNCSAVVGQNVLPTTNPLLYTAGRIMAAGRLLLTFSKQAKEQSLSDTIASLQCKAINCRQIGGREGAACTQRIGQDLGHSIEQYQNVVSDLARRQTMQNQTKDCFRYKARSFQQWATTPRRQTSEQAERDRQVEEERQAFQQQVIDCLKQRDMSTGRRYIPGEGCEEILQQEARGELDFPEGPSGSLNIPSASDAPAFDGDFGGFGDIGDPESTPISAPRPTDGADDQHPFGRDFDDLFNNAF